MLTKYIFMACLAFPLFFKSRIKVNEHTNYF